MAEYGDLIWFLLIGLAAGWLAAGVMKRSDMGVLGNMIVGVMGAMLGGVMVEKLNIDLEGIFGNYQVAQLIASFAGAVVFLVVVGFLKPPKKKD